MKVIRATSEVSDGNMSHKWGEREEVLRHREMWLKKNGVAVEQIVCMHIEDGAHIVEAGKNERGRGVASLDDMIFADALVTFEPGVGLFLTTADCLPITFFDPEHNIIALAHCSRKSSIAQLVQKVVQYLSENFHSSPAVLQVSIGPGIQKESYVFNIPEGQKQPGWEKYLHDLPNGETQVDLFAFNIDQLLQVGVQRDNIEVSDIDTGTNAKYFSHYRAVHTKETEGRFATVIMMKS